MAHIMILELDCLSERFSFGVCDIVSMVCSKNETQFTVQFYYIWILYSGHWTQWENCRYLNLKHEGWSRWWIWIRINSSLHKITKYIYLIYQPHTVVVSRQFLAIVCIFINWISCMDTCRTYYIREMWWHKHTQIRTHTHGTCTKSMYSVLAAILCTVI